uniref:R3-MYB transcription factor n=1 Tax=Lactuca sativa TaxID=4236 RepID=A0A5C0C9V1_LACSA|nr:R3-MYB transcription factor [Lactuca sativa]
MDKRRRRKTGQSSMKHNSEFEEVSSRKWEFINMSEQEEDIICRMHKLVGNRWDLIAGRIPGRNPEEIERFWLMRHSEAYEDLRKRVKS